MDIDINIESQVSQIITDGVTDKAPSENAVFDALALKIDKHNGATYDTNAIQTVTAAEYAALTPNASTLYFIV